MGLAREILAFYRRLGSGRSLFSGHAVRALADDPGFRELGKSCGVAGSSALLTCLQALHLMEHELEPRLVEAEFVATLPSSSTTAARSIDAVVREMLEGAKRDVIAVGYEIQAVSFVEGLRSAASRVPVTLIWDRARAADSTFLRDWPTGVPRPVVWQDRVRDDAAPYAKMHGKALLVDGRDLLISSANFTFHGLKGNLEFGVRLRGRVAERAADVFQEFARSGLLERIT